MQGTGVGSTGAGLGCSPATPSLALWFENTTTELAPQLSLPPRNPQQQVTGRWLGVSRQGEKLLTPGFIGMAARLLCSERMQWLQLEHAVQLTLEERAPNKA